MSMEETVKIFVVIRITLRYGYGRVRVMVRWAAKIISTTLGMFTRHSFNGNSFVVSAALAEVL